MTAPVNFITQIPSALLNGLTAVGSGIMAGGRVVSTFLSTNLQGLGTAVAALWGKTTTYLPFIGTQIGGGVLLAGAGLLVYKAFATNSTLFKVASIALVTVGVGLIVVGAAGANLPLSFAAFV